jgi:hypothetical protein
MQNVSKSGPESAITKALKAIEAMERRGSSDLTRYSRSAIERSRTTKQGEALAKRLLKELLTVCRETMSSKGYAEFLAEIGAELPPENWLEAVLAKGKIGSDFEWERVMLELDSLSSTMKHRTDAMLEKKILLLNKIIYEYEAARKPK